MEVSDGVSRPFLDFNFTFSMVRFLDSQILNAPGSKDVTAPHPSQSPQNTFKEVRDSKFWNLSHLFPYAMWFFLVLVGAPFLLGLVPGNAATTPLISAIGSKFFE